MIEGRTAQECFEHFRLHLATLFADVLSDQPPLLVRTLPGGRRATMSFPEEQTMRLESTHGDLRLYVGQEIEAYERKDSAKKFTLRTCAYWYRIFPHDQDGQRELLRWEYERHKRPETPNHCRNHLHVHTQIELPGGTLDLKKVHLPTGYVIVEDVLRFLFVDLGVRPATEDWPARLAKSEDTFRTQFSPWGPPAGATAST